MAWCSSLHETERSVRLGLYALRSSPKTSPIPVTGPANPPHEDNLSPKYDPKSAVSPQIRKKFPYGQRVHYYDEILAEDKVRSKGTVVGYKFDGRILVYMDDTLTSPFPFKAECLKRLRKKSKKRRERIVGSVRIAGGCGPSYTVKSIKAGMAEIQFPESGECIQLPVSAVKKDPIKDQPDPYSTN